MYTGVRGNPFIGSYASLGFRNFNPAAAVVKIYMRTLAPEIYLGVPFEFIRIADSKVMRGTG